MLRTLEYQGTESPEIGVVSTTARLKEKTARLHELAEHSVFQKSVLKGTLQMPEYSSYLSQLLLIHETLEERLRVAAFSDSRCTALIRGCRFREPLLRDDMASLGDSSALPLALKATRGFLASMAGSIAEVPISLLGYFYVLEGSTNGGRFIAKAVRRAFKLGEHGAAYFDPYGENQATYWREFKVKMDSIPLDAPEYAAIEQSAKDTFLGLIAIGEEILSNRPLANAQACAACS